MKKLLFFFMPIFLGLTGCEGGIDLTGNEKEDKGVNVYMTIVMNNAHNVPAYLMLETEPKDESTLVAANSARTTQYDMNLTSDSRFEHTYDLVIKARWIVDEEEKYTETTHVVDYKKYELDFENIDEPPSLKLKIMVAFDGTKLTVSETRL